MFAHNWLYELYVSGTSASADSLKFSMFLFVGMNVMLFDLVVKIVINTAATNCTLG